jgi:2-iminobutanoate/2-iminopropanoate deaminase
VIRLAPFLNFWRCNRFTGESLMTIRRHNPPTVHPPVGRYSHVTVHPLGNGLKRVVLAGQVGVKPDGAIAGDLAAQIEQAWDNLLACLASEKLGAEHLVKIVYFTTVNTPEGLRVSREIRVRKLGGIAPSSTYLVIAGLAGPDYKVEIEGEAVGPE